MKENSYQVLKEERNPFPSHHSYLQNCIHKAQFTTTVVGMRQIRSGDRAVMFTTFHGAVLREKKFSDCVGIANYMTFLSSKLFFIEV